MNLNFKIISILSLSLVLILSYQNCAPGVVPNVMNASTELGEQNGIALEQNYLPFEHSHGGWLTGTTVEGVPGTGTSSGFNILFALSNFYIDVETNQRVSGIPDSNRQYSLSSGGGDAELLNSYNSFQVIQISDIDEQGYQHVRLQENSNRFVDVKMKIVLNETDALTHVDVRFVDPAKNRLCNVSLTDCNPNIVTYQIYNFGNAQNNFNSSRNVLPIQ